MKHYFTISQIEQCEEARRHWSVKFRSSKHSFTGCVLDMWFALEKEAGSMARRWSQAIGQSIKIRRDVGGLLKVSIPVQKPSY